MPAPLTTEAIVLRSIRYGEADRVLHLYTPEHGRLGAIAKGARRARSRFGGRLEPCARVQLVLHHGRGDLLTVSGADTLAAHPRLRGSSAALDSAARACDAVGRLFAEGDPNPAAFHLLGNVLALLDTGEPRHAGLGTQLAFRLKLLVAAGLAPQLSSCAGCGEAEHLAGFSGAAGGVVCTACERAITEMAEHHAGLRLRAAAAGPRPYTPAA